jgi:hypothetical protein
MDNKLRIEITMKIKTKIEKLEQEVAELKASKPDVNLAGSVTPMMRGRNVA